MRRALWWFLALLIGAVVLALSKFTSTDPDSTAYAEIAGRMATQPVAHWIAPEWNGTWNLQGLFREHPVGIFVVPALIGRLGFPADQAAFVVGMLTSLLCLWLAAKIVAPLTTELEAAAVPWSLLILPVAFVYRGRANQEYPVLACLLLALWATERARRAPLWIAGIVAGTVGVALIKGIFVVFVPTICALWLVLMPRRGRGNDAMAWAGVVVAVLAIVPLTLWYEATYVRATGESFLQFYLNQRIAENAGLEGNHQPFAMGTKLYNVVFYVGRAAWFGMPGTLALLLSAPLARLPRGRDDIAMRGVWFALVGSAVYILAMSVGANKAERFIFPAYFFIGAAGALVAMRRWNAINRFAQRLTQLPDYVFPLVWLVFFLLALYTEHRIVHPQLWQS